MSKKVVQKAVGKLWESLWVCGEKVSTDVFGCSGFVFGLWETFGFSQSFAFDLHAFSTRKIAIATVVKGGFCTLST